MAARRLTSPLVALCSAALLLVWTSGFAAGRYDAKLRFRVLRTAHFTIYFHQGEAEMAQRLAAIAERVRGDLAARTGLDAPRHTHVVLVDQSDIANGWSTPVPYNLIEIAAIPPPPSSFLGHHDDWLRIVFTHEYAHVLHLDRVGGVMKGTQVGPGTERGDISEPVRAAVAGRGIRHVGRERGDRVRPRARRGRRRRRGCRLGQRAGVDRPRQRGPRGVAVREHAVFPGRRVR